MNNVISVDTLLASLESYSHEALTPKEILIINKDLRELKTSLHSLLISKLPEKIGQLGEKEKINRREYALFTNGYNQSIDDMRKSIDEMFRSGDE